MQIYIDFDGVIMDTETHLFDDFAKYKETHPNANDFDFVSTMDWNTYLKSSKFIDGSLEYLDDNPDAIILTKVCSINEAKAKINILREYNIFNNVVVVPYGLKKTDVVSTFESTLVDDTVHNLDDFILAGGNAVYFNKDNNIVDPWKTVNSKYVMIDNLKLLNTKIRKRNK